MKNVYLADVSSTPPAFPDAMLEGYPKDGASPTQLCAWWYHMVTMELMNAVSAGGVTPDATKVNQLATVIANLVQGQATIAAAQAAALAVGTPYGAFLPWPGETPPPGYIKANGILLPRTGNGSYPKLTASFLGGTLKVVTDAVWTAGAKGSYSSGDGSTNYRIPDIRADFLRGVDDGRGIDSGRVVGTNQADELRSHGHQTQSNSNNGASTTGFQDGANPNGRFVQTSLTGGSETRPRNVAVLWCIRAYDPT